MTLLELFIKTHPYQVKRSDKGGGEGFVAAFRTEALAKITVKDLSEKAEATKQPTNYWVDHGRIRYSAEECGFVPRQKRPEVNESRQENLSGKI